jgi:hypothetical protein
MMKRFNSQASSSSDSQSASVRKPPNQSVCKLAELAAAMSLDPVSSSAHIKTCNQPITPPKHVASSTMIGHANNLFGLAVDSIRAKAKQEMVSQTKSVSACVFKKPGWFTQKTSPSTSAGQQRTAKKRSIDYVDFLNEVHEQENRHHNQPLLINCDEEDEDGDSTFEYITESENEDEEDEGEVVADKKGISLSGS